MDSRTAYLEQWIDNQQATTSSEDDSTTNNNSNNKNNSSEDTNRGKKMTESSKISKTLKIFEQILKLYHNSCIMQ